MADALGVDEADPGSYDAIISKYLTEWGLSSLTSLVNSLGKSGATQDSIALQIQNSDEYKTRFAGNEARVKAGLSVLSPAEYIALEGQYKQVLRSYGMPAGFYDSQ